MKSGSMDVNQVISMLEEWFSKLPALPANLKATLVKIAPWLALVFGILGVVGSLGGVLALLGLGAFGVSMMPYGGLSVVNASAFGIVVLLLGLAASVLMLMAYPGLKDQKMSGWKMAFWSEVVSLLGSLVAFNFVGLLVGALIGFYILFQIKSSYK